MLVSLRVIALTVSVKDIALTVSVRVIALTVSERGFALANHHRFLAQLAATYGLRRRHLLYRVKPSS